MEAPLVQQAGGASFSMGVNVAHEEWSCPRCGCRLEPTARWVRLVTREPDLVPVRGYGDIVEVVEVGGDPVIPVRCGRCDSEVIAGRDIPLAAA